MDNDAHLNGVIANNTALHKLVTAKTEGISIANQRASQARRALNEATELSDSLDSENRNLKSRHRLNLMRMEEMEFANRKLTKNLSIEQAKSLELEQAVAQRDAIIFEWMHSSESFKRLAKQYGAILGISQEQGQTDLDKHVLNVATEDPDFANTKKTQDAKVRLGQKDTD